MLGKDAAKGNHSRFQSRRRRAPHRVYDVQTGTAAPRVLVVTTLDGASQAALLRGASWARLFDGELHVLSITPGRGRGQISALPPSEGLRDALRSAEELTETRLAAASFCTSVLGTVLPEERLHTLCGEPGACMAHVAEQLGAACVMVPGVAPEVHGVPARTIQDAATWLVRERRVPVLVCRQQDASQRIVGASDFSDREFPVLSWATDLGARLEAPVTLLHNLNFVGFAAAMTCAFLGTTTYIELDAAQAEASAQERLAPFIERPRPHAEARVTHEARAAAAILHAASEAPTDLVVVGAHLPRLLKFLSAGSADEVVAEAPCSVLVVPLDSQHAGLS